MKSRRSWLRIALTNVREFFWPLLDDDDSGLPIKDDQDELKILVSNENLEKALELKFKIYDSEVERRKSIESKASLFIGTVSVTTSIVVAASALITSNNEITLAVKISVFISFILSIYTFRTVWFSVKALARGTYWVLVIDDINIKGSKAIYYKRLISTLTKKTKANQDTINQKVDNLVLAQEYYKRAIVVISIYAFFVLIFCLFFKNQQKAPEFTPKYVVDCNQRN